MEETQAKECRSASFDMRWQQLNAAYGIVKGLGILQADPNEMEVYKRWGIFAGRPEEWSEQPENITPLLALSQVLQNLLSAFNDQGVIIGVLPLV